MSTQLGLFDDAPQPGEYAIPDDARPGRCRSCNTPVAWTTTPAGKPMPLSLATARSIGGVRYATSHFADCPHAKEWSKKR
jgi:hypothetical protein